VVGDLVARVEKLAGDDRESARDLRVLIAERQGIDKGLRTALTTLQEASRRMVLALRQGPMLRGPALDALLELESIVGLLGGEEG